MAIVWGRPTSSNVQLVMWGAAEMGVKVERVDVGGSFGQTDTPEYRALNPNGLVPTYQDGDLVLFESAAILRYLGATYGSETFWPQDPASRAKLDVWAEWTKTTVYPVLIGQIFWTLIRTPKAQRNMDSFAAAVTKIGELMSLAEKRVGESKFLGGDDLCFADIVFGHLLYRYFNLEFDRANLPELRAYYDRLNTREAYQTHVMIDYNVLRVE